jgi:hypothetical protein
LNELDKRVVRPDVLASIVAGKSRPKDFYSRDGESLNPTVLVVNGAPRGIFRRGDEAMWIVLYVATIATLSAMGIVPAFPPAEIDEDPMPEGDI